MIFIESPLNSENLSRKKKTLRILNISGKNFLRTDIMQPSENHL